MIIDGQTIHKGDTVHFKSDVEQCGTVVAIKPPFVTLKAPDPAGFDGDYIGGSDYTEVHKNECWVE